MLFAHAMPRLIPVALLFRIGILEQPLSFLFVESGSLHKHEVQLRALVVPALIELWVTTGRNEDWEP